jgi:undecaprenyl-diphosphatase
MADPWLNAFDLTVLHWINGYAGNFALDHLVKQAEENPLFRGALFITAFWALWFAAIGDRAARREKLLNVIFAVVASIVVARAISLVFPFRLRPMYADGAGFIPLPFPVHYNLEDWSSFPSDTGAYFFAIAVGFWGFSRTLSVAAMIYCISYIALPRIYLGLHWPSDLIAGCAVGALIALLIVNNALVTRWVSRPLIEFSTLRPGLFYSGFFLFTFEMVPLFSDARGIFHGLMLMARKYELPTAAVVALTGAAVLVALVAIVWYVARTRRRAGAVAVPIEAESTVPLSSVARQASA